MKSIFKSLFLIIALSAVPVFAQSDFESTKARAEAGDAQAQWSLGVMYIRGEGVAKNDQEGVRWTRLAAEQSLARGQRNLGILYSTGTGVAENDQEAVKWYRLAAEQGDATAQSMLGLIYANGTGLAENTQRAYVWFSVAAAQGDEKARTNRDIASERLTPQALEQAQAQATRCFDSNFKDCD